MERTKPYYEPGVHFPNPEAERLLDDARVKQWRVDRLLADANERDPDGDSVNPQPRSMDPEADEALVKAREVEAEAEKLFLKARRMQYEAEVLDLIDKADDLETLKEERAMVWRLRYGQIQREAPTLLEHFDREHADREPWPDDDETQPVVRRRRRQTA